MLIRAKKNRTRHIQQSKAKKRERLIQKQLVKDSKRGGIVDKRRKDKTIQNGNEADILRRNILEKLKTLNDLKTYNPDDSENIVKALKSSKKFDLGAFADDLDDENIDGDVVNAIFDEKAKEGEGFKDFLARKIEETRVARQMRVESNEINRETMQTLNEDWSNNIRFILDKIKISSKQNEKDSASKENRKLVNSLLESLSSSKSVVPATKTAPKTEEQNKNHLEKIFEKKFDQVITDKNIDRISLLKVLSAIMKNDDQRSKTVLFVSSLLGKYPNIEVASFTGISQVEISSDLLKVTLFLLYLVQQILEISRTSKLFHNEVLINSFRIFHFFLSLTKSPMTESSEDLISLSIIKEDNEISEESRGEFSYKIVEKFLNLFHDFFAYSESIHESLIIYQIFSPLLAILSKNLDKIPSKLKSSVESLIKQIETLKSKPLPPRISRRNIISTLLNNKEGFRKKDVMQLGIIPQLEPVFDEVQYVKGAKRPPTTDVNELNRRLKKEKRAALKEVKKDAQTMASVQLKKIRENDAERKRLTQGIIASMRSVEDMKK